MKTIIEVIVARHDKVRESLNNQGEVSLVSDIDD